MAAPSPCRPNCPWYFEKKKEQHSTTNSTTSSDKPSQYRMSDSTTRRHLQTANLTGRDQRFSWQDTSLEAQGQGYQQFSSPANSIIEESSPISPRDECHPFPSIPQRPAQAQYPVEKPPIERTGSPHGQPVLHDTHPAYSAPVADESKLPRFGPPEPSVSPERMRQTAKSPPPAFESNVIAHEQKPKSQFIQPDTDPSKLVYNPNSLAGPNAAVENHRPGQVAHPNATIDPEWKHGLCEVDTLCCVGLCCPCVVYGKTQYRLSRRTQKEDPTNMLGYESCNGSCALMSVACGFQCGCFEILFHCPTRVDFSQGYWQPFNELASESFTDSKVALGQIASGPCAVAAV